MQQLNNMQLSEGLCWEQAYPMRLSISSALYFISRNAAEGGLYV
jgi:hypothetical protein